MSRNWTGKKKQISRCIYHDVCVGRRGSKSEGRRFYTTVCTHDAEAVLYSFVCAGLSSTLTSFSPHIWLTVEPEAGLEAGPITDTTPLGRIWHTERKKRENKPWVRRHTPSLCFILMAASSWHTVGDAMWKILKCRENSEDTSWFLLRHQFYFEINTPKTRAGGRPGVTCCYYSLL